jgi:hypothetical protein
MSRHAASTRAESGSQRRFSGGLLTHLDAHLPCRMEEWWSRLRGRATAPELAAVDEFWARARPAWYHLIITCNDGVVSHSMPDETACTRRISTIARATAALR